MALEFGYRQLSNDEEHYNVECDRCAMHKKVRKLHWVAHTVSTIAIISLLALLINSLDASRLFEVCWNMHYYYCR